MNSFGLGLVLNFVDNASAGMSSAVQTFNRMSATADSMTDSVNNSAMNMYAMATSLNMVGDTMISAGSSIVDMFGAVAQSVIDTGMTMQGYRMQLAALYGSTEAGEDKLNEIKKYAQESVFEIESLIPAVTLMKAVGIEAMDEVTTSSGSATQRLLDYASDIAAMVPNMRNTYGTGVKAAMGALKEYIAEGNALSLKRGAGLDIMGILGEEKGGSIEERTQQIADLVEKLNILGYTSALAGTPTQRLSNMQDALFNSLSRIADSGVFEVYCNLLEKVSEFVFNLVEDEERFNVVTGLVADVVTTLLKPLESVVDWLIKVSDSVIKWVEHHPKLAKNILLTVAAVGGLLIAGGALLKTLALLGYAFAGLEFIKKLPAMLSMVGNGFRLVILKAAPFLALAGLIYLVWSKNLFGIRDTMTKVFNDLGVLFSIVSDAWGDNSLSEENFIKARDLGILPFIEALLDLKYYWGSFVEGFKLGWNSFWDSIAQTLEKLGILEINVFGMAASLGEIMKNLSGENAEEGWRQVGEIVANILASAIVIYATVKILSTAFNLIKGIWGIAKAVGSVFKWAWTIIKGIGPIIMTVVGFFKNFGAAISLMKEGFGFFEVLGVWFPKLGLLFAKLGGFFSTLGGWLASAGGAIGGFFSAVGSAIMSALTAIATALGISVGWVIAIIVAIVAAIVLIVVFWDEIKAFFIRVWEVVSKFFVDAWNVVSEWFSNVMGAIGEWFSNVVSSVKAWFKKIVDAILSSPIVQSIIRIVNSIKSIVMSFIDGIVFIIKGAINVIITIVRGIIGVIRKVGEVIATIFKNIWKVVSAVFYAIYQIARTIFWAIVLVVKTVIDAIVTAFNWVKDKIVFVLQAIGDFFSMIFNWIYTNVIQPFVDWIVGVFTTIWDFISGILQKIGDFFNTIFTWVKDNVIQPFSDWLTGIFDGIASFFEGVASKVQEIWGGVKDFFGGVFDSITETAGKFFDWIGDKLGWVMDAINSVGDFFGGVAEGVGDFFKGAGDKLKGMVGLETGGYVKTTGIAVLHPNEVVVNDDTTQRLQTFLGDYENKQPALQQNGSVSQMVLNNIYPTVMESVPVTTVPASVQENTVTTNNTSILPVSASTVIQRQPDSSNKQGEASNDYSVTFAAGSVVIQLLNATEAELEKAADKIMKIIARKQKLRAMATRA